MDIIQQKTELVYANEESEAVTNSFILAREFDRNHKDVLRTIRNKLANYSKSFTERNFAPSEYRDESGKTNLMYELTRDGFWAIVLGFTGDKAAKLQELFILEFNRRAAIIMELQHRIQNGQQLPALPRKKYKHRYGYLQVKSTADGFTEQEWVTGAKTIEEMTEIENHARLQHKRIGLAEGNVKAFIASLHERDRYCQRFLDLLDDIKELSDRYKPKAYGSRIIQVPIFSNDGAALFDFSHGDGSEELAG
ncbi:MAG TPA: Rha family transcriptional regulator [Oligoflexus sp.]|uniref:Rha family transcriptional regulator n=1 Tax=Oligoflexus sp. TaxID=1971216 RepID=UPI002D67E915|nr:Rha family transcriptional regulator [Oligoflexus sp.]HYX35779.1 Rha family transcriptional regulator [Oligoflexus sp.]